MVFHQAYWLAFSQIPGIGPTLLKRIHNHFGTLALAWEADEARLQAVEGLGEKLAHQIITHRPNFDLEELLASYSDRNPQFITPEDPEYPTQLWEIPDPPAMLHYQGSLALLNTPSIAIVGTRDASDYGKRWTRRLTQSLGHQGFTIISGLAAGIDAEAHATCLTQKTPTIAVLGTGVEIAYPKTNQQLHSTIAQSGLILSEYPAGTGPDRRHFPRRNRIVAGLTQATLVTEAGEKSGALITARLANDYGRSVYALAGSLDNPNARGCLQLIHQGAEIILGEAELLTSLGTTSQQLDLPLFTPEPPNLRPELEKIWRAIGQESIGLDRLLEKTGLNTPEVSSGLLELELLGLVEQQPGLRYICC